jgi:beta-aspartyl-peptidase (threonine type)
MPTLIKSSISARPVLTATLTVVLAFLLVAISQPALVANQSDDTPAQAARTSDRRAIEAVLSAQQNAWNRGDVDAFLVGYWHSPDLTFSGSGGVSRGWEGVLARYKKNYPDRAAMGQLDFSDLEFHFLGPEAALVLGHWQLKREGKSQDGTQNTDVGGVFSLVWQRFPEGWRIIHDHTSAVAPK